MKIRLRRYRPNPITYHVLNLFSIVCTIALILAVLSNDKIAIIITAIITLICVTVIRGMD